MKLTTRERFNRITSREKTNDILILDWFHKTLVETPLVWVAQGAPESLLGGSMLTGDNYKPMNDYFGYEHLHVIREIISGLFRLDLFDMTEAESFYATLPLLPVFPRQILSEDELHRVERHFSGETLQVSKKHPWRMPMYTEYPVKGRATWNEYKKRLDPHTTGRLPANWKEFVSRVNKEEAPNLLSVCGFFGPLRHMMGLEPLLYSFYDDPTFVEEMMEYFLNFNCEMVKRVMGNGLKVEMVMIWEDMAYRSGPLISPTMVKQFMIPRYRKLCDVLRQHGVEVICVDSDGDINKLIKLWLDVGVNAFWPLEVASGMDAVHLRKTFGADFLIIGNIDKRVFPHGNEAVRNEVMGKVPYLMNAGGYIPCLDHNIGPDVPLSEYRYYLNLLRGLSGLERLPE